jgi:hypothetical protein
MSELKWNLIFKCMIQINSLVLLQYDIVTFWRPERLFLRNILL